jgi:MFS family permease
MTVLGIVLLSVANTLTAGLVAAGFIGFSMGSEGDITPYLLGRYFGLKRFSTLYALTWTTYAVGGATGPILVGRVFDTLGSYRPITFQLLLSPPSSHACLCSRFPATRFKAAKDNPSSPIPQPAEIAQ